MGKTRNVRSRGGASLGKQQSLETHLIDEGDDDETSAATIANTSADDDEENQMEETHSSSSSSSNRQSGRSTTQRGSSGGGSSSVIPFLSDDEKRKYMDVVIRISRELNIRKIGLDSSMSGSNSNRNSGGSGGPNSLQFEQKISNAVAMTLSNLIRDRNSDAIGAISDESLKMLLQHIDSYHNGSVLAVPRITFLLSILSAETGIALRLTGFGLVSRMMLLLTSTSSKLITKRHALSTLTNLSVWAQFHPSVKKELLQKDILKKLLRCASNAIELAQQKRMSEPEPSGRGAAHSHSVEEEESIEISANLLGTLKNLLSSSSEKEFKKSAQIIVDSGTCDLLSTFLRFNEKPVVERAVLFLRQILWFEPARVQLQKDISVAEAVVSLIMTTENPELLERTCGCLSFLARETEITAELSKRKDLVKKLVSICKDERYKSIKKAAPQQQQHDNKKKRKQQSEESNKDLGEELRIAAYNALSSLCQSCPDDTGEYLESLSLVDVIAQDLSSTNESLKHCAVIACFNISNTLKTNVTHVIRHLLDLKILTTLTSIVKNATEKMDAESGKPEPNPVVFSCVTAIKNIVTTATLDGNEANTETITQAVAVDDVLKQILQVLDEQERAKKDEGMSFRRVLTWLAALVGFLILLPFIFRLIKHGRLF